MNEFQNAAVNPTTKTHTYVVPAGYTNDLLNGTTTTYRAVCKSCTKLEHTAVVTQARGKVESWPENLEGNAGLLV